MSYTNAPNAIPSCIGCYARDCQASAENCQRLIDQGVCRVAIWRDLKGIRYGDFVDVTAERVKGEE